MKHLAVHGKRAPEGGRFLSEDPAGIQGGLNLYAFGGNDPINAIDPSGTRPLTSDERYQLEDICDRIDCGDIRVFDGHDEAWRNALRETALSNNGNRSFTLGHDIYLSNADIGDISVLAHELTHSFQFDLWGSAKYYKEGIGARFAEARGEDPYSLPRVLSVDISFSSYSMEQQGRIVEQCFQGNLNRCIISPFQPRTSPFFKDNLAREAAAYRRISDWLGRVLHPW